MRLDHLLSKEKETCEFSFFSICSVLRGYSLLCQISMQGTMLEASRHYIFDGPIAQLVRAHA